MELGRDPPNRTELFEKTYEIVKIMQADGASDRSVHGNLMRIQCGKKRKGELVVKLLDQAPGLQVFL